jgi:hypothetical protein
MPAHFVLAATGRVDPTGSQLSSPAHKDHG